MRSNVLALKPLFAQPVLATQPVPSHTLTGTSMITVAPDMATLTFEVKAEGDTASPKR